MEFSEARQIVRDLTYKSDYALLLALLHEGEYEERWQVLVQFAVPDARPEHNGEIFGARFAGREFDRSEIDDVEALLRQVHETIAHFEQHEILENLKYQGTNVWEPHRYGYGVWDIKKATFNLVKESP